jgi:hypothetical protein
MVANSSMFRPKPMVDCIHLLTTLLQALPFSERLQIYNTKKTSVVYTKEILPPETNETNEANETKEMKEVASEGKKGNEDRETEFEWRVRVVYRLYSLLFPQISSSITNLIRNLEEEKTQKPEEGNDVDEYGFFFLGIGILLI